MSSPIFSSPVSIFVIIILNSLSGIFFITVWLSLLLWFCPVLSFRTCSFVSSFCLTLCVCFLCYKNQLCLLHWKVVALWRRGLVVLCCVVSHVCKNLLLQEVLLCVLHVPCYYGWVTLSFSAVICNCFLAVLVCQSGDSLGLS